MGIFALGLLAGCAHAPAPRPPAVTTAKPSSRPRPRPGYDGLIDSLNSVDASVLRDRRIVLDPGHGGSFTGCLGAGGTTEAQVNLGVALELRALLLEQGALVCMTRESDRDFLTPSDSALKTDLAERVNIANAFHPDLFLSIHHNADASGTHDINETQTYYQLGDDGPSPDAASDVHRSLVRNLGVETQKLLPGNFAVVRGSEAPALLTEASYLTNPDVEARLKTPQAQRLEAEALYLGLARFFARKAPQIESFEALRGDGEPDTAFTGSSPTLRAQVHGTFDDAVLRVDGQRVEPLRTGAQLQWTAGALAGGPHEATLAVRLAGEGASRARRLRFTLHKPPARIAMELLGAKRWDGRQPIGARVRVYDGDGLPCTDSVTVRLRVPSRYLSPANMTIVARDGVAWGYFRRARRTAPNPGLSIVVRASVMGQGANGIAPAQSVLRLLRSSHPVERTAFALRGDDMEPLLHAPGTEGLRPAVEWLNRDGFVVLPARAGGEPPLPRLAGYRAWGHDGEWPPSFVAIAGGALEARRIVLDPEGGGDDAAGMGPSGTRAATLNLEVARALAAMLRAAGAQVVLTRERDAALSEVERVQIAEGFRADRYLRIGHAAAPPIAGHYFASGGGRRWAQRVAESFAALGLADSLPVGEAVKYPLTQTSAVALYVSFLRIDERANEARLLAPGTLRAEAYALFAALAAEAAGTSWPVDSVRVFLPRSGEAPVAGALVTLGGTLVVQTDERGVARFMRTEPGPLELLVDDSRIRARALLLDSERGGVLTGAR